jgi:glycosyltransferase involved in cell wall biosynthesis
MRIVQIIDSLQVGGAEKMAVNFANSLSEKIDFSGLVVTRNEGPLKSQIDPGVGYLFLDKKSAVDLKALFKLKAFCVRHQVEYVHAHGTSFFIAFLLKMIYPQIKVVWHEHAGARIQGSLGNNLPIWFCSRFFSGIIVVNQALEKWFDEVLKYKNVIYLPNFTLSNPNETKHTILKGTAGKRILCLANLRPPKNHHMLIDVAAKIKEYAPEWTFHLVGKDFGDTYSRQIHEKIKTLNLQDNVYTYGLREDTGNIISQCTIGILTSTSEGLPVALLEYGLHEKGVVSTNVGEIPLIISNGTNGYFVPSNAIGLFAEALTKLIANPDRIKSFGRELGKTIVSFHSEAAVITQYLNWLKKI